MATCCAPKAGTTASAQHNNTIHLLVTTRPPQICEETEIDWTELRNLGCAGSVEKFSTLTFTCTIHEDCRNGSSFVTVVKTAVPAAWFRFFPRNARNEENQASDFQMA